MRYRELFEYNVQDLKNRYMGKIRERLKEENSKYTKMSDEELLQIMDEADPTPTNKYVTWIALRYAKGDINRFEDIPSRIGPALKEYWQMFNKKLLKDEHRNLGKIKNIEDVLKSYKADDTEIPLLFPKDGDKGDYDILHNSKEFLVIQVSDKTSACYFGHNTRWCTARTDQYNQYDDYAEGDLIIIVDKKNNRKYQIHEHSGQYMDEEDKELSLVFLVSLAERDSTVAKILNYEKTERGFRIGNRQLEKIDGYEVLTEFHKNARVINKTEWWYKNGKEHREDGPAYISYFVNGNIHNETWYKNGKKHREDGPANIFYDSNGNIKTEWWFQNGKVHREDGPANIFYDSNGNIKTEWWLQNGKVYREDGPAYIEYNTDGTIRNIRFYISQNEGDPPRSFSDWLEIVKDKLSPEKYDELVKEYG